MTDNLAWTNAAQSLPTDKAAAEAIFVGGTSGFSWFTQTLEAASTKWDTAQKVCTAVNKTESIVTITKELLDAAKAA